MRSLPYSYKTNNGVEIVSYEVKRSAYRGICVYKNGKLLAAHVRARTLKLCFQGK